MNKPKILHLGLMAYDHGNGSIQRSFRELSSEYADYNPGNPNFKALSIREAEMMKPDLIFMQIQEDGKVDVDMVQRLRATGAKVYNWNGDVRTSAPGWMLGLAKYCTKTLYSNMRDVKETRSHGFESEWLEIGYDETIYKPEGEIIRSMPIVFFGNNSSHGAFPLSHFRNEMCNFLRGKFSGNFGEYGNGMNAIGSFNHSQHDEAAAYRFAKIAINCSHYEIEKYSSDRMLRILGTGTAICLAKWYPGIEDVYSDGIHLRIWHTLDELESLIHFYQNPENESERIRIAQGGMKYVQNHFTFNHMVTNLINL